MSDHISASSEQTGAPAVSREEKVDFGLPARRGAVDVLSLILHRHRPLEDALSAPSVRRIDRRDRALMRHIVVTVLRRKGQIETILKCYITSYPTDFVHMVLLVGVAQILFFRTPPHAVVDVSVRLVRASSDDARFSGFVNGVLRKILRQGGVRLLDKAPLESNIPSWLLRRWRRHYGKETARCLVRCHTDTPALDISPKSGDMAERARLCTALGGVLLPNGTIRVEDAGRIPDLAEYALGTWWVQDFSATFPVRLLGDVEGKRILDLCAAPGGKTAQLAALGADVVAVDNAAHRLKRLEENLSRLGLSAEIVETDGAMYRPERPPDMILLDVPCLTTGTIRRHPDIPYVKRASDLKYLIANQKRLLLHAIEILPVGGILVYCNCSLEVEEGEHHIDALLSQSHGDRLKRVPVLGAEIYDLKHMISPRGYLRILPFHALSEGVAGMDGFFAARLKKIK